METVTRVGEARIQYTQIFEQTMNMESRKTKVAAMMGYVPQGA